MLSTNTMKQKNQECVLLDCPFHQRDKLFAGFTINSISRNVEKIDAINLYDNIATEEVRYAPLKKGFYCGNPGKGFLYILVINKSKYNLYDQAMFKLNPLLVLVMLFACCLGVRAQQISKEELLFLTPEWKGERFPDGRPKVPDAILDRMKLVTLEEAWAVLRNDNYKHQYVES